MSQCLYIEKNGRRCAAEAAEDSHFCWQHSQENSVETSLGWELRRLLFRLVALLVLAGLLIPLLYVAAQMLRPWLN